AGFFRGTIPCGGAVIFMHCSNWHYCTFATHFFKFKTRFDMSVKVAINGFGRIGRLVYRQIHNMEGIDVVAINDLTSPAVLAHLLKYDSAQGRFNEDVVATENAIKVNGHEVKIYAQKDPAQIPWGQHEVDVVIESTGFFTDKDKAAAHLKADAK